MSFHSDVENYSIEALLAEVLELEHKIEALEQFIDENTQKVEAFAELDFKAIESEVIQSVA